MKLKFLAAVGLAATLYSCDDTTTGVGEFVAEAVHTWVNSPIRILERIPPISSHKSIARKVLNFRKTLKK